MYTNNSHKTIFKKDYSDYFSKLILLVFIVIFSLLFKRVIITFMFVFLEFIKEFMRRKYKLLIFPIPFFDLGILLTAYFYPIIYPILLLPTSIFIKLYFGQFKFKYVRKLIFFGLCIFIVRFFRIYTIAFVIPGVFFLRYIMDYILGIIISDVNFEDILNRILSSIVVFVIFQMFSNIIIYVMV